MKITIVGYYGSREKILCGQMIKVRTLYEALKKFAPEVKVEVVDTNYISANPLVLIWQLLKCLLTTNKIIFLAAERGRIYMFPFFFYVQKILGIEVYHDSIGGGVIDEMDAHPRWTEYLNSFKVNWMESPQEVQRLQAKGVRNAKYIPNFKRLKAVTTEEMEQFKHEKPYRFCTFCRVEPMKGIEDALLAIRYVNEQQPGTATLDVYGLIQPGEEEWFEMIKAEYKAEFRYCGVAPFDKSAQTIAPYLAMLFPTRYATEGMPGTIVDAMFAGVPVIARRWYWCDNMLTDGYNGIVYDFDKPKEINDILLDVCQNPNRIKEMKRNCLQESEKYSEEYNFKQIMADMKIERQ